jgi:D-alanine-D-alanine ligase
MGLLQNKAHYFYLLSNYFPTPQTYVYRGEREMPISLSSPEIIIKPALECAALGVKKLENQHKEIYKELREMREKYQQNILAQEYIDGYEVSVSVIRRGLDYIALPPVWLKFESDILTFELVDQVRYEMFALPQGDFPFNHLIPQLLKQSQAVMSFLGTSGITRVDYRIAKDGRIFIIDIAALPMLAQSGTCQTSFLTLYPDNPYSLFQAIIGAGLFNSPSS